MESCCGGLGVSEEAKHCPAMGRLLCAGHELPATGSNQIAQEDLLECMIWNTQDVAWCLYTVGAQ